MQQHGSNERAMLDALLVVSGVVNASLDLDEVLSLVLAATSQTLGVEAASLLLADPKTGELVFHVAQGEGEEQLQTVRLQPGEGIVGWVHEQGKPAVVNNVRADPRFTGQVDQQTGFITRSILCVPLRRGGTVLGAIELLNKLDRTPFNDSDLALCEAVAAQSAIAIHNARMHAELVRESQQATLGRAVSRLAGALQPELDALQRGLQAAGGLLDDLPAQDRAAQGLREGWQDLRLHAGRLTDLCQNMLALAGRQGGRQEPVLVNELVRLVVEQSQDLARRAGIALAFELDDDIAPMPLDKNGVLRCLRHLIANSVEAFRQGERTGLVTVRTRHLPQERAVEIEVNDNGCGIPVEDHERVFDPFFSYKNEQAAGLGLSLVQKIAQQHHGSVSLDSGSGKGTTVTLRLAESTGEDGAR